VGLGTTGLQTLQAAQAARTTVMAPYGWQDDDLDWRTTYGRVDPADRERLRARLRSVGGNAWNALR
jgi:hypothetical protein